MKQKIFKIFVSVLWLLLLSGCGGQESGEVSQSGRYVEEDVEIGIALETRLVDMVQDGNAVRLASWDARELISTDKGINFSEITNIPSTYLDMREGEEVIMNCKVAMDGGRIFMKYIDTEDYRYYLVNRKNECIELTEFAHDSSMLAWYGMDEKFYCYQEQRVYQVDADTGECKFLFEVENEWPHYMCSDGKRLYMVGIFQVYIYDLEKGELAEPDTYLEELVAGKADSGDSRGTGVLLYPDTKNNGVYVLTKEGLFYHTLYEDKSELLIEGYLCNIGNSESNYLGMAVFGKKEKKEFMILYSDGALKRYVFDPDAEAAPEISLRIFSVHRDTNVERAIDAYKEAHPEAVIKYEVAIAGESAVTVNDVLKNLTTELAAGQGPDILLMDSLPYETYVEKGVLMELDSVLAEMGQEQFHETVLDSYRVDGKLYTVPLCFSFPIIGGDAAKLEGVETLSDLADMLEEVRKEKPEGALITPANEENTLRVFAEASQGAWMKEDGTFDKAAVTAFLTDCHRIWQAQDQGITELERNVIITFASGGADNISMLTYDFGHEDVQEGIYKATCYEQPFFAGYMTGEMERYPLFLAELKFRQDEFMWMPGQNSYTCLPFSLASVNNASLHKEEAAAFLKLMLSAEFQSTECLSGEPINREAQSILQEKPKVNYYKEGEPYTFTRVETEDGRYESLEVYWPTADEFNKWNGMTAEMTGANRCDAMVFEAVIEFGTKALQGDCSIEEAADEIEKKVQLYLAE